MWVSTVLQADLPAREGAAIVEETLKDLLVRIRTPERPPPPVGLCITEEELFHRKNPKVRCVVQWLHSCCSREGKAVGLCTREAPAACRSSCNSLSRTGELILLFTFSLLSQLHYRHREVEQLHDLWTQRVAAPPALGEEVPAEPAEEAGVQRGGPEALPARRSAAEGSGWKRALEATPSRVANVGQQEPGPPSWNFSLEDLQQVVAARPSSVVPFPLQPGCPM